MSTRSRNNTALVLLVSLILLVCSFDTAHGARVRGDSIDNQKEQNTSNRNTDTDGQRGRRNLFADKWGDPNNPARGGAAARAKGFQEVILMRERVTPDSPTATPAPQPPNGRNDQCSSALGPIDVSPASAGNSGAILYDDTTEGARIPMVLPDRCDRISNSSPGVWYRVLGTGQTMIASLCWSGTEFDSKITVYTGACFGVMTCVGANDDAVTPCSANRQASRVTWSSTSGVTYYLLIHGFGTQVGEFQLSVQTQ